MFASRLKAGASCAFLTILCSIVPALAHDAGDPENLALMALPIELQQNYAASWQQPLGPVFVQAAQDYKVPDAILLTLGQMGSAFENRGGAPTIERGYGIMALRDNTLGGDSLNLAAQLTGSSVEQLKLDPVANIVGAAAVLDSYARDLDIDRKAGLEAWQPVLVRYAALDGEFSQLFAAQVYQKIERGFALTNGHGETFTLAGTPVSPSTTALLVHAPLQTEDYGGATDYLAATCNYSTATHGSDTYVIHTIEGSASGCLSWFRNCAAQVSSNYVASEAGGIWRCVPEDYTAWTQSCYNSRSVSTEHEGYAASASHPTALYNASALCTRDVCNRRGIPKAKTTQGPGIIGHVDITNCCCGSHTDPGAGWDWGYYMGQVVGTINPPYTFDNDLQGWTAGNCMNGPWFSNSSGWPGILYLDQTCNDVFVYGPPASFAGHSNEAMAVRLYCPNTSTHDIQLFWTSTANTGWSEANSSGIVTYSAPTGWTTVALPLNTGNWINQTITRLRLDFDQANSNQRWHVDSLIIIANQGNLTGTVTSAATSAPLVGASVTLTGVGNTTTNGSGVYSFNNVTGGTYTVSVSATSYAPASASVAITAGATATKNFALAISDLTPPTQPTNLVLAQGSGSSVQLNWTASTDNIAVTGYDIRRDGSIIGSSATNSYTDNTAVAHTPYVYDVRAKDAVLNYSAWSDTATVDAVSPSKPTNLVAIATGASSVQLNWTASSDNVAVTGYDVHRGGSIIGSSVTANYTDNTAVANTSYTYDVRAKDGWLNYSDWSDPTLVTTPLAPGIVFQDGFDGNLNSWTQSVQNYDYSTTVNHGTFTGGGAAYMGAGQSDQMYHSFARPFAQGTLKGYYWDGRGGWQTGACGWQYRQCLSLRDADGASKMQLDNEIYSAGGNPNYFYRLIGVGSGGAHTAYATRDAATDCSGTWVAFQTTVTPGTPGGSPAGTFTATVTDRAATTSTTQNLSTDFFAWGFARITLGVGNSSANEGYWDDISLEASPPGTPTMNPATVLAANQIRWNFTHADNNYFGWDVADAGGTVVSPNWPSAGWTGHNALSWTESSLTPNTSYNRKVKSWNGTLNSLYSGVVSARTLSPAPGAGSVTPDNATPCAGSNVTWTAVGGFGAGKVEYYAYAWDTSPSHTFSSGEAVWSSGTLVLAVATPGTWYLHLKGYNAANVANGTFDYSVADADSDNDGTPNCLDGCPNDPGKTAPGVCGCGVADTDSDNDGTPNCNDQCSNDPGKIVPETCGCGVADTDSDSDGTLNCNDGCPNDANKIAPGICGCGLADTDSDNDGTADCLDGCPNDPGKTAPGICGCGVADTDSDNDGTPDCDDQCPNDLGKIVPGTCGCGVADTDSDSDGTPNCNDGCPNDANKIAPGICGCGLADTDSDNDGTLNCNDGCPDDANKIAPGACGCGVADTDTDNDGTPDCNDLCPDDSAKSVPGQCGCGNPDTDSDTDGTADCNDLCSNDPNKTLPEVCGCGLADTDSDNDGTPNCLDGCPADPDKTAPGQCGCGNPDTDSDHDGTADCVDNCPADPNKVAPGACGCGNPDTDSDHDGTADCLDGCTNDPGKTAPGVCGCGVTDTDSDNDGIPDCNDQCSGDPNKVAPGQCGCGHPDTDTDGDTIADCVDNCPTVPNVNQTDTDGNGTGDACELPVVVSAVSRKTHGDAGAFDINVTVPTAVESRNNGPTQVVVTFDKPIGGAAGLDNTDVSLSSGSVTGVSINGSQLTVDISGATNGGKLVISFPGIVSVGGATTSTSTVCFGALIGDVNDDGTVNIFDLVAVRNTLNQTVSASTFRSDVTADGTIDIFDLVTVRNNLNTSVASCP